MVARVIMVLRVMEHGAMGPRVMEHGAMEQHGTMVQHGAVRAMGHDEGDQHAMEHGAMGHDAMGHDAVVHGAMEHGTMVPHDAIHEQPECGQFRGPLFSLEPNYDAYDDS